MKKLFMYLTGTTDLFVNLFVIIYLLLLVVSLLSLSYDIVQEPSQLEYASFNI